MGHMYALHCISLGIYITAIYFAVDAFSRLIKCDLQPWMKFWLTWFIVALILKCVWFVVLQYEWILNDKNSLVGGSISFNWLLFDYFNGFVNLCIITAVRIYLKWDCAGHAGKGMNK